jgi:LytS/YehU family sensor histidine kinase
MCGIILGPKYGFLVGLLLPLTRSFIIGTPPMGPIAISMTFELAAYGLMAGLLYGKLPKKVPFLYVSLIGAMLFGRVVWAASRVVLLNLNDFPFSFEIFLTSGFATAWMGIALQIVLIPILILALRGAGWRRNG